MDNNFKTASTTLAYVCNKYLSPLYLCAKSLFIFHPCHTSPTESYSSLKS